MKKNKWGIQISSTKDGASNSIHGMWCSCWKQAVPFGGKSSLLDSRVEFNSKVSAVAAAKAYTESLPDWTYKAEKIIFDK